VVASAATVTYPIRHGAASQRCIVEVTAPHQPLRQPALNEVRFLPGRQFGSHVVDDPHRRRDKPPLNDCGRIARSAAGVRLFMRALRRPSHRRIACCVPLLPGLVFRAHPLDHDNGRDGGDPARYRNFHELHQDEVFQNLEPYGASRRQVQQQLSPSPERQPPARAGRRHRTPTPLLGPPARHAPPPPKRGRSPHAASPSPLTAPTRR
jgi:hypothetical protein